ncbi:alpha/beta hydrolase fold domain-containing protein [Arenibaculum pallidiluteum]|uniref:alpha/beta hydrolase fold domain-containing protein n=1 Tax=Arenibaculum pallidiluteum TaxID=2812559 RepID=UPI001A9713FD|nr:alpha/beta hydrolase fold domain-containing protein [Arenibaculum pallidiluteum]
MTAAAARRGRVPAAGELDPAVVALYAEAARRGAAPADPTAQPLAEARMAAERFHRFLDAGPRPAVGTEEHVVEGPAGQIPIRLYRGSLWPDLPVLVYFHGGGFVLNSLDTHDRLMRTLALRTGFVVCGVGYAKAPERRFPHQHGEALAVLRWVAASARALGLDADRFAVGGDSAGANLALAAALACRAADLPRIACGLLFYGMFARDFDTESHRRFGGGAFGLTSARMRWYWDQYLGSDAPGEAGTPDPRAAPLNADLRGLPPMLLVGAGLDCLLDDTLRLADRLRQAGVPHRLEVRRGLPHGFATMGRRVAAADDAVTEAAMALRAQLDPTVGLTGW